MGLVKSPEDGAVALLVEAVPAFLGPFRIHSLEGYLNHRIVPAIVNFQVTRRLPSFWFYLPESSSGRELLPLR
jgi:hypothetical protein